MCLVCVKHSFCNLRPLTPRGGTRVVSGRFPDFTLKEELGLPVASGAAVAWGMLSRLIVVLQ